MKLPNKKNNRKSRSFHWKRHIFAIGHEKVLFDFTYDARYQVAVLIHKRVLNLGILIQTGSMPGAGETQMLPVSDCWVNVLSVDYKKSLKKS